MPIQFKSKYEFGDIFYLINDPEQEPRELIGISLTPLGPMYTLDLLGEVDDFYEFQISTEFDKVKKYTNGGS